jgi:hypothetical protein
VDRFPLPSYLTNIASIDWGKAAQCHINWGACLPNKTVAIHTQYGMKGRSPEEWARDFCDINKEFNTRIVVIDPSSRQSREKESIYDQFVSTCKSYYGGVTPFRVELADNARVSGKNLLHDYLRWKPLPVIKVDKSEYSVEYAAQLLRFQGEAEYNKYLAQFEDIKEEQMLPRLVIFKDSGRFVAEDCVKLEDSILACVYDDKRVEDVAEFVGDDPYDSVRYLIKEVDRYFHESVNADEKARRLEEVYQYLRDTQDQNGFQWRMAALAREENSGIYAVSKGKKPRVIKGTDTKAVPALRSPTGRNQVFAVARRRRR